MCAIFSVFNIPVVLLRKHKKLPILEESKALWVLAFPTTHKCYFPGVIGH